jgi:hypothetical protein
MAARTVEKFVARAIRLYEQEPGEALASAGLGCRCGAGLDGSIGAPAPGCPTNDQREPRN